MQNINETINEVLEVRSDDNILEIMRVKLRENVLTRRKENRASAWDKNRVLGDYRDEEFFSIKYVDEKVTLLKRRKISFKDYRRLSNALIQVCIAQDYILNYYIVLNFTFNVLHIIVACKV